MGGGRAVRGRTAAAGAAAGAAVAGAAALARHLRGRERQAPVPRERQAPALRERDAVLPAGGRERTVRTADGVELHVVRHGPDEPVATVVLAHGYAQSSRLWAGQVRDLRACRPEVAVVTYDHRGHGRSGPTPRERARIEQLGQDLLAVLDAVVPTGPVVLVGHSMGGMTIMALAEQRPELFRDRVVGVGFVATSSGDLADLTFGLPAPVAAVYRRVAPVVLQRQLRRERSGLPRHVGRATVRLVFGAGPDPEAVRLTLEDMAGCTAETVAAFRPAFAAHDRRAALAAMAHLPAVVVVGEVDRLIPAAHGRVVAAGLPRAELAVHPGAGHMVHLERRPEVSRQLLRLLDRALAERAPAAGGSGGPTG